MCLRAQCRHPVTQYHQEAEMHPPQQVPLLQLALRPELLPLQVPPPLLRVLLQQLLLQPELQLLLLLLRGFSSF